MFPTFRPPVGATLGRPVRRPILFLEPTNGLSNRLRAIASARALARATARRLVIVWKRDVQCNISLMRLIETRETVIDSFHMSRNVSLRNYSNPRDVVRVTDGNHDVYIRTPFVVTADVRYEHLIAREFRSMRPTPRISDMVSAIEDDIGGDHEIAVHVRMLSNYTQDVPGVSEDLTIEFTKYGTAFRERCHWRHFVDPLRYIGATHRTFTIDADVPEAPRQVRRAMQNGNALMDTCVGPARRQAHCVEVAFAHILFMARSSILLLSHWSSYSELVRWFAPRHSIAVNGCLHVPTKRTWVQTSIVVACHNRDTAATVIQNALHVADNSTEVVVVDWTSDRRIPNQHADSRVRVIRVENAPRWNIAQAYNVGFRHASGERILKIDCDTRLSCMPTPPPFGNTLYTGDWRSAGHLNGIVYVSRSVLEDVGGYDERLNRYGWDDDDLYRRIERSTNLSRREISANCLQHIPHTDRLRGLVGVIVRLTMTQMNRLCIGYDLWNASRRASSYRTMYNDPGRLLQVWKPDPIESTSRLCNNRLATAAVLFGLFSECKAPRCKHSFWRISKETWVTTREFMTRLIPTHIDTALECVEEWPEFVRPSTVKVCASALEYFDAAVRTHHGYSDG